MEFPGPDRWNEINTILTQVLEHPAGERREALEEACADDPALRREVEGLLDAAATYDDLFDEGAEQLARPLFAAEETGDGGANDPDDTVPVEVGERVGAYHILERVGEGGASIVYRARRVDEQFQRVVALKVLRRTLDGAGDAASRFRAERQILASLSHPHLAAVYDGGVGPGGHPYLVMEYVEGRPITEHCRAEDLSVESRLALLRQVAEAVQAAHEQTIVHRDLKPENVLVDRESGAVKLVDFGIAKILGELPGAPRPATQTGAHPMTPAYAAPEQVKGEAIRLATDTYALGVLLYELLTDRRPFGEEQTDPYAVARAVCEDEPVRPSDAVDDDRRERLRGDLDAIVMKALRKHPEDRYDTVGALLDDLDRYCEERPVQAHQGHWTYRARKFVRRNRRTLTGALLAVLLIVGVVTYHVQRLSAERDQAQRAAEKAEQVSQYLVTLFEEADPEQAQGASVTARDLLHEGMDRIETLDGQPLVQAELAYVLGKTRRRLGLYDSTRALLEQAYTLRTEAHGRTHAGVADVVSELALLSRDHEGNYAEAESLMSETASIYRAVHGPRDPRVAEAMKNLVYVQRRQGKLEAATESVQAALSIQRAQPEVDSMAVAESLFNLGAILEERDKYERAEQVYRRSLALCRRHTDGPHPGTAVNLDAVGFLMERRDSLEKAEDFYREALAIKRSLYGDTHPGIANTLNNLAKLERKRENYREAETQMRTALRMRRTLHDGPHPNIAAFLHNLGGILHGADKFVAADSALQAARSMLQELDQEQSETMAFALEKHGNLFRDREQYARAEAAYKQAISVRESIHGTDHPKIEDLRTDLGELYEAWDKPRLANQYTQYTTSSN